MSASLCTAVIKSGKRVGSICGRNTCKILHDKPRLLKPKQKPKPKEKPTRYTHSEGQISVLCRHINEKTSLGERAIRLFKETGGGDILEAHPSGSKHFDFTLTLSDGRVIKVEAKGTKRKCVTTKEPWYGVQMYNGNGSRFSLAQKYSTLWYERFIASGYITKLYDITTPIPSYDDWVKDVFSPSKGNSAWTKEIRLKRPSGFSEERIDFVKAFNTCITEEDKSILANQVMDLARHALSEKQYWVQIHSDLDNDISDIIWTPQVHLPTGMPVVDIKTCKDVVVSLTWEDGRSLQTILGWGYNHGISNLRMDIK